jgi:hypothetical protein
LALFPLLVFRDKSTITIPTLGNSNR